MAKANEIRFMVSSISPPDQVAEETVSIAVTLIG